METGIILCWYVGTCEGSFYRLVTATACIVSNVEQLREIELQKIESPLSFLYLTEFKFYVTCTTVISTVNGSKK